MNQEELRRKILETAKSIGANPIDLATAISYETGGTFDPLQRGPTTQWGQHKGLIQFGEPQAQQFGVDWNDPLNSQLGANGAVAKYMKASGFQPGMSGLDLYSTINAGAPGKYGASDAGNGGAPGDVRAKWETQMADHRAKAARLMDPYDTFADGPKGQESYKPDLFGSMAPGGGGGSDRSIPMIVADHLASLGEDGQQKKNPLEVAGAYFSKAANAIRPPQIGGGGGDARSSGDALLKVLQNPGALAQLLMKKRLA